MKRTSQAFSLIELLVVMAIVGVMATAVMLTLRPSSVGETMDKSLARLARVMQLALDEAQIQGEELGLHLDDQGYSWLVLKEGQWLPVVGDKIYEEHAWPVGIQVFLKLENFGFAQRQDTYGGLGLDHIMDGETNEANKELDAIEPPQVTISSSGEVTPFQLVIVGSDGQGQPWYAQLSVDFTGTVKRIPAGTEVIPVNDFQVLVP